jgi:hypothetical protein
MEPEQQKQETPKGHEIPVPTREEFEHLLQEIVKRSKPSPRRPKK